MLSFAVVLSAILGMGTAWAQGHSAPAGPETPSGFIPRFHQMAEWESRSRLPESVAQQLSDPPAQAVAMLGQYTGAPAQASPAPKAGLSPLEWPRVFAGDRISPRRLRIEMEARMRDVQVAFRELIALENGALADSIAAAIAAGQPVVLNAPEAPILFGYDRREPDAWWWMQLGQSQEILLDSERRSRFVYWADDPAANIAWAVTGTDTTAAMPAPDDAEYEFLSTVGQSVQGNASIGLHGYPITIRAFQDSLVSARTLPTLGEPIMESDPIGIRRVLNIRSRLVGLLENLALRAVDTTLSQPLRLALYFYHNSIQSLEQAEALLYHGTPDVPLMDRCRENWRNDVRRPQAADAVGDALEWERQAAEQITLALTARKPERER